MVSFIHSSVGCNLSSNSLMCLVPVVVLLKVYLRLRSRTIALPVIHQQFSFLAQRRYSCSSRCWWRLSPQYSTQERSFRSYCPVKVNSVLIWSQEWKLNLNAEKNEDVHFPLGPATVFGNLLSLLVLRKFGSTPHPATRRRGDVSLYVPVKSQLHLKWNSQPCLDGTSQDVSVVRLHDILLERGDDTSRGRNNDVSSVRLHDVLNKSQMKHPTTSHWYVTKTSQWYVSTTSH